MRRDYLIYALKDPRNEEIRYIGQSTRGLTRPRAHASLCWQKNSHSSCWIKQLLRENLMYGIEVLEEVRSIEELNRAEQKWIKLYKDRGIWPSKACIEASIKSNSGRRERS